MTASNAAGKAEAPYRARNEHPLINDFGEGHGFSRATQSLEVQALAPEGSLMAARRKIYEMASNKQN
jgi:hypothetical protein